MKTNLDCEVCKGTGKYDPDAFPKPCKLCSGICQKCGQHMQEDDYAWLRLRLDKIDKALTQLNQKWEEKIKNGLN